MDKREKEVIQSQLDAEKAVIEELRKQYQRALNDIDRKIRILQSDELTQSKIYQLQYQKVLKSQVEAILEKMHADEYSTIQKYLSESYTKAFIGTMYAMHGQDVPVILPIDQNAAVKAVMTDSKIKEGLYKSLGVDANKLKKTISAEITRGIATAMPYNEIARNIAAYAKAPYSRAKTIVRTEAHRIQQASTLDAQNGAKAKGADVVKQWDSTLDGDTRPTHRKLDGQIREIDEPFEMDGKKAMYPGDFGDPAEDCNCRCVSLTRARWALDEDELKTLKQRAEFFGLDKTADFEDFSKKYLNAAKNVELLLENDGKNGIINSSEMFRKSDERRKGFTFISQERFDSLTVEARKKGAIILRGTPDVEQHLNDMGATASHVGGALLFMNDVCVSEVLEETHHFMQELMGLNADKEITLRTLLNEIDARHFILNNAKKYKVPRNEIEMLQEQLNDLNKQLEEYYGGD